jgi:competence protein ComEC
LKATSPSQLLARNPLLPFAAAAVCGIVAADLSEWSWWMPGSAALASALVLFRTRARSLIALFSLTIATTATLHTIQLERLNLFPLSPNLEVQHSLRVAASGTLIDFKDPGTGMSPPTGVIKLDRIELGSRQYRSWHRLRVVFPRSDDASRLRLATGDRLQINGSLRAIMQARNPGSFSRADASRRRGIVAELVVFSREDVTRLPTPAGILNSALSIAARSRAWIARTITDDLQDSPDVTAVLRATVLGSREQTPREIEDAFRNSGSMHIFAVSGLHVGILAFIIWQLLKLLRMRRSLATIIVIPCLFYYALITGWRPSAVRAAIMTSIFLAGFGLQRQPRILNSLGAAALAILLYNTQQLFMPGFQLSFVVLTSIALFARPLQRPLQKLLAPDPFLPPALIGKSRRALAAFGNWIAGLAAISAAAWIGSAPLVLWHFKLLTPIALIANCALVPVAFAVLATATLSILSASAGLGVFNVIFNNANGFLAKILLIASATFASLPGSHFYIDHFPFSPAPPPCRVTILDTGDGGGSQLIELSSQEDHLAWLIDAGDKDTYFDVVRPLLRERGWTAIDALVLSHGDSRHLGGAPDLIRDFQPRYVFESPLPNTSPFYRKVLPQLKSAQIPLVPVTTHDTILDPADASSCSLRVLYPPPGHLPSAHADDQCLILQLQYHGWRILFMNDSGFATEKWLLDQLPPGELQSHILVKGRHASDFTGLPEFLNAVNPLAVVSTNAFFPPEEQVPSTWKAMLSRKGIPLFDQAETGAVDIQCHPDSLQLRGFLNDQEFTQQAR